MAELNVYQKLNKVQNELIAPKNQFNSFGKYKYRSCEDILEGLKMLLDKYQAVVLLSDDMKEVNGKTYLEVTASFVDVVSGNKIEVKAVAREAESKKGMDDSQVTGSTSSYARKYALNGLFAIDDTKDADARKADKDEEPKQQDFKPKENGDKASEQQVKMINVLITKTHTNRDDVKAFFDVSSLNDLTKTDASKLIKQLQSKEQKGA